MKTVLTIAGSDCSGGAGIQADLKTIGALGAYGMSVIVSLTAQNTCGVNSIQNIPEEMIIDQLKAVFEDIRPDAVKIGMLPELDTIKAVSNFLKEYEAENIVVDPVMVATSGAHLVEKEGADINKEHLFPLATVITPNMAEAEYLTGIKVVDKEGMEKAAKKLSKYSDGIIMVKGGHLVDSADDYIYKDGKGMWIPGKRIDNNNTHGTGCTLSSAIATFLAKGYDGEEAIKYAKEYLTGAIKDGLNLGKCDGPLNHFYKTNR